MVLRDVLSSKQRVVGLYPAVTFPPAHHRVTVSCSGFRA